MKPLGIRFPLAELDARFIVREAPPDGVRYRHVDALELAHGVNFLCPKCYQANKGAVGTHRVTCWFVGKVPADANPGPGRWQPAGAGLADLTFVPVPGHEAVSVRITGGCCWHGFIVGGCATVLPG